MIEYVDPIPPVVKLLNKLFDERVYGNTMPENPALPCILVRNMGGSDSTRLQLLVRGRSDIEAMALLIRAMNNLIRFASRVELRGVWIEKESSPIMAIDEDTKRPEAWAYLRMEHLES